MATVLRSRLLDEAGFAHAFSTRNGGVSRSPFDTCNLARSVGDDPEHVAENRRRFAQAAGFAGKTLFGVSQVHGARTVVVVSGDDPALVADEEADAIVATADSDAAVGVRVADCVPVLLADPDRRVVAAVHAGWRGVVRGVVASAIGAMRALGARPDAILAAIGPHIRVGAFEVGPEVAEEIRAAVPEAEHLIVQEDGTKPRVDLMRAVIAQLRVAGLRDTSIDDVGGCTWTEGERFFSFRRDGKRSGRLVGAIHAR